MRPAAHAQPFGTTVDVVFDVAGYRVPVPVDDAAWLRRRLGGYAGALRFELSHALTEARHGHVQAVEVTPADAETLERVLLPPPLAPLSEPLRHLRYAVTRRLPR